MSSLPYSGQFADTSAQIDNGIKLYMKQHGDTVAGKKIEIIRKDTGGPNPDVAKRLAQELVVRDKVDILAGFALTPEALGAASVADEAKKFMVVMNAATAVITEKSPYIVRVSLTLPMIGETLGTWAVKKGGVKKAYTMVTDYGPGHDAEAAFQRAFKAAGRRDRRIGAHADRQSGLLGLRPARQGPQSGIDLRVHPGRRAAGGAWQGVRRTRHGPKEDQAPEHRRAGRRNGHQEPGRPRARHA